MGIGNIGSILGPNVGGLMVQYWGWESVFWINIPIGIVALLFASIWSTRTKYKTEAISNLIFWESV